MLARFVRSNLFACSRPPGAVLLLLLLVLVVLAISVPGRLPFPVVFLGDAEDGLRRHFRYVPGLGDGMIPFGVPCSSQRLQSGLQLWYLVIQDMGGDYDERAPGGTVQAEVVVPGVAHVRRSSCVRLSYM